MSTALATRPQNGTANALSISQEDFALQSAQAIDDVIGKGDLSKMSPTERVNYYRRVCDSLGLNPLTKPFEYVDLKGLKLYATKGCTDQLRGIRKVSLPKSGITKEFDPQSGIYTIWVTAVMPDGREDTDFGSVCLKGLGGEALANATMKAMTKAKRRATLSICGLGWLDETEVETIPYAQTGVVDVETGEVIVQEQPGRGERIEGMLPDDPLKQLIFLLAELSKTDRDMWRNHFAQKWGTANPKMFSREQVIVARDAVFYKDWPDEEEYEAPLVKAEVTTAETGKAEVASDETVAAETVALEDDPYAD